MLFPAVPARKIHVLCFARIRLPADFLPLPISGRLVHGTCEMLELENPSW